MATCYTRDVDIIYFILTKNRTREKVTKSVWGMPRVSEAKKDVPSCEKLRGTAEEF
jgi:hypothetical protein